MLPLLIGLMSLRTEDLEMISDDKLNEVWSPDYSKGSTCHPVPSHLERSDIDSRIFTFTNSGELEGFVAVQASSSDYEVFRPHISDPSFTVAPGESHEFTVDYNCLKGGGGWADMKLKVVTGSKTWDISYTKLCDDSQIPHGDISLAILLGLAVLIVWLSALLATSTTVRTIVDDESNDLQMRHVWGFILMGSVMLVMMFFFLVYLEIGLVVMVSFSSFTALLFTLTLILPTSSRILNLPLFGPTPASECILAFVSLGLVLLYVFTKNWILNNLIGLSLVLMFLKVLKLTSFKVGAAFLSFAFIYDIFWVFYSSLFFGESVMIYVAQHVDLPMKLECPYFSAFPIPYSCSLIGLGDLVLPGLVIVFARRIDRIEGSPYFKVSLLAYTLALVVCGAVLVIFESGQPALMYISPALIGSLLIVAWRRSELTKLWKGLEAYSPERVQHLEERLELVEKPINS